MNEFTACERKSRAHLSFEWVFVLPILCSKSDPSTNVAGISRVISVISPNHRGCARDGGCS